MLEMATPLDENLGTLVANRASGKVENTHSRRPLQHRAKKLQRFLEPDEAYVLAFGQQGSH